MMFKQHIRNIYHPKPKIGIVSFTPALRHRIVPIQLVIEDNDRTIPSLNRAVGVAQINYICDDSVQITYFLFDNLEPNISEDSEIFIATKKLRPDWSGSEKHLTEILFFYIEPKKETE